METDKMSEKNILAQSKNEISQLKELLLDEDFLNLSMSSKEMNIFDVLRISKAEIRHSNVLAWLLDPNGTHGISDIIMKELIKYIVTELECEDLDAIQTLLMDCSDFSVLREWNGVDILIESKKEKILICIENKVMSGEHSNQLSRYYQLAIDHYQDNYKRIFLFLSPAKDSPEREEDRINWKPIGYEDILKFIENAKKQVTIASNVNVLIDNYIEIIRRDIVGDDKTKDLCQQIYKKHKEALDLIFENKWDYSLEIAENIKGWFKEWENDLNWFHPDWKASSKSSIRFSTDFMNSLLPPTDQAIGGWKTGAFYCYEIVNRFNGIHIQLVTSSVDLEPNQQNIIRNINYVLNGKKIKDAWTWRILNRWNIKCLKTNELDKIEALEEFMIILKKEIIEIISSEIPQMEDKLRLGNILNDGN